MNLPWRAGEALPPEIYHRVRRQAIFQYHKWDQQVGDVATFCPWPLIVERDTWRQLTTWAEALAAETQALETELLSRPELHARLGLPRAIVRHLRGKQPASPGVARLIRFDFHLTTEGWRISEANTDVPGGWNEATGYPALLAPHYPGLQPVESMVDHYAQALAQAVPTDGCIGLVHATAYTDDRQAMVLLAEKLQALGLRSRLLGPDQIGWISGQAPFDALVRYYPAEWLPNLPGRSSWPCFFSGSRTPMSNPATALLTQTKRLPLVWDRLPVAIPTWRKLLPACADPREVPWETDSAWVVKPALGRVGHGIGLRECMTEKAWLAIRKDVRRNPGEWVAQRRFDLVPLTVPGGVAYPCLGIYTIDGQATGAYGRVAARALVDHEARDVAVFLAPPP